MKRTKMILATNARILWGGDDSIQTDFTKIFHSRGATRGLRR